MTTPKDTQRPVRAETLRAGDQFIPDPLGDWAPVIADLSRSEFSSVLVLTFVDQAGRVCDATVQKTDMVWIPA